MSDKKVSDYLKQVAAMSNEILFEEYTLTATNLSTENEWMWKIITIELVDRLTDSDFLDEDFKEKDQNYQDAIS